jgi:KDO2-lipid IV(A) lauroyltransferase
VVNRASVPLVPLELARRFALPWGDIAYRVWRSKARAARRNYARILNLDVDHPHVDRMARECFRQFALYMAELIDVQGWDSETVLDRLDIEGEDHFAEAAAHGRGIVFVSAHMGSTEVAASIVVMRGYRITSVVERLRPQFLMDWAVSSRARMGITLLPVEKAGLRLVKALRRKEMVAFVVDAGVGRGGGVPVAFCGRETVFPSGPARLARLSGAPLVFGMVARRPGGRFMAHMEAPIAPDRALEAGDDVRRLTQRIADIFEVYVRRYPAQWYAFRDMWPEGTAG